MHHTIPNAVRGRDKEGRREREGKKEGEGRRERRERRERRAEGSEFVH